MIRIALRMLIGDRMKYIGLVAGLAFAALLITQQGSIFAGYTLRSGSWIRDTAQADLWIMDPQVSFTEDRKAMLDSSLLRVRGIEGIEWAVPMYKAYVQCRLQDGTRVIVRLVGIDDATLTGGPPLMLEGTLDALKQDRGVLVDGIDVDDGLRLDHASDAEGPRALRVGDRLDINEHETVVVGIYGRTTEFFWDPVIYTTYSRALRMAPPERKQLTFVLAKVKRGFDAQEVAARITASTGLRADTSDQFEQRSMDYILSKTGILVNFGITIGLGFVIGVLISGQLLYNFILENQRAFAAMKAMGADNWMLLRMVFAQVLLAAFVGFGIGVGVAAASGAVFEGTKLAFMMAWQVPVFGGLAILVCSLLAALISIQRVLRLEPAIVFKG
ncbi:MAG: FtsX-like permease family protein [Planctomycetes bacterium]|nr:FtsX-like permease family protein [Planctomycetota bacterium]